MRHRKSGQVGITRQHHAGRYFQTVGVRQCVAGESKKKMLCKSGVTDTGEEERGEMMEEEEKRRESEMQQERGRGDRLDLHVCLSPSSVLLLLLSPLPPFLLLLMSDAFPSPGFPSLSFLQTHRIEDP